MNFCKDRVVIITGAGAGLGKAYALELASQGASVVVNDIRLEAAQEVVAEIAALGGRGLANGDDITTIAGAEKIVRATVDQFNTVHALVNNAGVLRDKMFVGLTEEDWDMVVRVHMRGHFCLANTLANYWRDLSKAGNPVDARIINTSSGAGLQGSIGQSNYAAAKGGIATLTLVQASELARYGITANALAPAARTAMTLAGMPDLVKKPEDGSFDHYDPANVASFVAWLVSESSKHVSGQIFEVDGDRICICEGWKSGPALKKGGSRWESTELTAVVDQLIKQSKPAQKVWGS
ncbi:SDR family NAD(P)-dependent oxidoreductase [Polynucleobacter sp. 30F-ANTBAC]|jgi:NAD(P)-dependent dehydrogenase (short-subunit alcohol dehydrogenase family)|uniref:SDR family oxidoreductase n=1 Tax=Polynucleobacter sp. 30F-ANTBAC TaxID=2689095 RepID=UPI001C0DBC89|nr:SDR family oxidoreductase [Polynucleobacter sp. 30F-ANTBAC]MBU3600422.1 SDR family NAD(P)-dependent oxidoreductase [Polynucleobacter sp. 30F-ANTBAC]